MKNDKQYNGLMDFYKDYPGIAQVYSNLFQYLMRDKAGSLNDWEREVLAMHVSKLNDCGYCESIHACVAQALGADPAVLDQLRTTKMVSSFLSSQLRQAIDTANRVKLNLKLAPVDNDQINALAIIHAFNMINGMVKSLGLKCTDSEAKQAGKFLANFGYAQG